MFCNPLRTSLEVRTRVAVRIPCGASSVLQASAGCSRRAAVDEGHNHLSIRCCVVDRRCSGAVAEPGLRSCLLPAARRERPGHSADPFPAQRTAPPTDAQSH